VVGKGLDRGLGLRLLLDTHAVYWVLTEPERLSQQAAGAIPDPTNDVFVSAASVYEMTFKIAIGKLKLGADVAAELTRVGFAQLPLTGQHAYAAGSLPLHHRDPWDRILIAQAQVEGLTIVTRDPAFEDYQVATLPA
jgi:PIN domain nuclease of toxin-antitoxin system